MKKLFLTLLTAGAALYYSTNASAQLVINELMQSNIDCIMDDLNEFPDSWVELYNAGHETVNLASYKIGTSDKIKKAYSLPSQEIKPGEFIVIYCDKAEEGLHTSFRLESGKDGAVYLFHNDEIVDKLEGMKKQPAPNIAYGKETENSDKWGYQDVPTPGASNCGTLCKDILGEPVFSVKGKVFTSEFSLELSIPEDAPAGTTIRFTTDGREPTAKSARYKAPLSIDKTKVVRAKLFCDGYLSPRSTTHSYIIHPRDLTLPVVSIVTNEKYFYDDERGIYVEGSYTPGTPNYEYDWRRPINYEYFEEGESESVINQLCETRVKGGATRGSALKSLAVYANKRFGTKRFEYEFFPDQTPGINEYKSFEMRNSGNDFDYMYMRDAVIQQCMGMNVDLDWQPSRPVILYINGKYKGILNIRPRSNEDYVYSYYDGLEDLDMLENWEELKEGSIDNFNAFQEFYTERDHSYPEFQEWMDTEEFCNLMIMGTFFDNKDFPGNNIVMWRPQEEGGKWRWIAKDTDFGMGLYGERSNYPTLNWITTPGYDNNRNDWANNADHTRLFRRLLDTPEFRDMFINRCAAYMGDFLTKDAIIERINQRYDELKYEYKYHRELFNPWWPDYNNEIESARRWTRERWTFFYRHLADFFGLQQPVELTIDKGTDSNRTIVMNDVVLNAKEFNGKYFPGRKLTVNSRSDTDNLYTTGWKVTVTDGSNVTTTTYNTETLDIEMPKGNKVEIESLLSSEPNSIESVSDAGKGHTVVYDLSGREVGTSASTLSPGLYIIRRDCISSKVIIK